MPDEFQSMSERAIVVRALESVRPALRRVCMEDYRRRRLLAMLPKTRSSAIPVTLRVHPFIDGHILDYHRSKIYGLLVRVRSDYGDHEQPPGWVRADDVVLHEDELKNLAAMCTDPREGFRVRLLNHPDSTALGPLAGEAEGYVGGIILSATETGSQLAVRLVDDGTVAVWPLSRVILASTTFVTSPAPSSGPSSKTVSFSFSTPVPIAKEAWAYEDLAQTGGPSPPVSGSSASSSEPTPEKQTED